MKKFSPIIVCTIFAQEQGKNHSWHLKSGMNFWMDFLSTRPAFYKWRIILVNKQSATYLGSFQDMSWI